MSTITAKIQIFPDTVQAGLLQNTYSAYTDACNWLSGIIFATKNLNQSDLNHRYYSHIREVFALKSQMAQSAMKTVIARYRSVRSNQHPWNLVTFKKPEYDLVWNRDYSLNNRRFSLNTLKGRVNVKYQTKGMKKYFDGSWAFGTAKLIFKLGKWFLHIPVTKTFQTLTPADANHVVGIDLGVNYLATTFDGQGKTTFYSGKTVKQKRAHCKFLRKQLQKRQTPSARKRLKAIGQRENRYVSDINHQVAKALVDNYPSGTCFVLEDLTGVRSATEKVRVKNRYVSVSWAFYQFRLMLEYKAAMNGQCVIVVPPAYTSQTCPICGHTEKGNRNKKIHTFCCKNCAYTSNDDRIGAMNLYRKGLEVLGTDAS